MVNMTALGRAAVARRGGHVQTTAADGTMVGEGQGTVLHPRRSARHGLFELPREEWGQDHPRRPSQPGPDERISCLPPEMGRHGVRPPPVQAAAWKTVRAEPYKADPTNSSRSNSTSHPAARVWASRRRRSATDGQRERRHRLPGTATDPAGLRRAPECARYRRSVSMFSRREFLMAARRRRRTPCRSFPAIWRRAAAQADADRGRTPGVQTPGATSPSSTSPTSTPSSSRSISASRRRISASAHSRAYRRTSTARVPETLGHPAGSPMAYAHTMVDFVDLARTYGRMGGLDRIATLVKASGPNAATTMCCCSTAATPGRAPTPRCRPRRRTCSTA